MESVRGLHFWSCFYFDPAQGTAELATTNRARTRASRVRIAGAIYLAATAAPLPIVPRAQLASTAPPVDVLAALAANILLEVPHIIATHARGGSTKEILVKRAVIHALPGIIARRAPRATTCAPKETTVRRIQRATTRAQAGATALRAPQATPLVLAARTALRGPRPTPHVPAARTALRALRPTTRAPVATTAQQVPRDTPRVPEATTAPTRRG